jgi:hypothetical protein
MVLREMLSSEPQIVGPAAPWPHFQSPDHTSRATNRWASRALAPPRFRNRWLGWLYPRLDDRASVANMVSGRSVCLANYASNLWPWHRW